MGKSHHLLERTQNTRRRTTTTHKQDGSFSSQTVLGSFLSALPKDQLLYYEMYDGNETPRHIEAVGLEDEGSHQDFELILV